MGLEAYVCDELRWGIREVLRASRQDEVLRWDGHGGTLCLL